MAPFPLLLVVTASLTHATWNLLAKRAAPAGPIFVCAYNLVSCAAYAPWMLFRLSRSLSTPTASAILILLVSGTVHLAYSLVLQRGYQNAELSIVYPVARGIGPTLSTIAAVLILGEAPHGRAWAGLALVLIGIAFIATQGDISAFRRPEGQSGVRWGAITGSLIAGYTVTDAYAVRTIGFAPVILDWFSNALRFMVLAPLATTNRSATRECLRLFWREAVAVGLLSPLGYILILAALASGAPLSQIAPMREMSMMVGALLGMFFLGERVSSWRLGGCGILIVGVVLLS